MRLLALLRALSRRRPAAEPAAPTRPMFYLLCPTGMGAAAERYIRELYPPGTVEVRESPAVAPGKFYVSREPQEYLDRAACLDLRSDTAEILAQERYALLAEKRYRTFARSDGSWKITAPDS